MGRHCVHENYYGIIITRARECEFVGVICCAGKKRRMKGYLLVYNGVLAAGWMVVLVHAVVYTYTHHKSLQESYGYAPDFYDTIRWPLLIFQTAAVMEVVHCAVGLVPAAVMTTLMQVYSRVFIMWAVVEGVAGVRDSIGILIVSYAWGVTEVIRYAYYFFSLVNAVPYILKWCRYTFFYLLYPIGVLGEMLLFLASLPVVKARNQWEVSLPNPFNISFSFYYFLIFTMLLYIPLFPQLYGHMIKQRRKIIGGQTTDKLKKKDN